MLAANCHPHLRTKLIINRMSMIGTLLVAALLLLLLPVTMLAALADFLWFRLRTALRGPQRPKGVWEL